VKLENLDSWNRLRRLHAASYYDSLPPEAMPLEERPGNECVYHVFPARFDDRDGVASALQARGIETGIHYRPAVHGHPAWGDAPPPHDDLPVAEAWAAGELSLPMHPDLQPDEIERVVEAVHAAVSGTIA